MGNDNNLLLGVLAVQMDLINRDDLIRALHAWVLEKVKPLAQILEESGKLSSSDRLILESLVARRQEVNNATPLQNQPSTPSTKKTLQLSQNGTAQPNEKSPAMVADPEPGTLAAPPRLLAASRFRILRPHAKGGLGEVFIANDEELNREVALKEIQTLHAFRPEFRSRFILEAEITGGLEHPGIVPVYGLGSHPDGRPYYAMRFIKGDSLQEAISRFHDPSRGKLDRHERALMLRELVIRFVDVCQAIAYAHSRGVLHRDLKPSNVMLGKYGETLIVDWGLAKGYTPSGDGTHAGSPNGESSLDSKGNGVHANNAASKASRVGKPSRIALKAHAIPERLLLPHASGTVEMPTQMGQALGTPAYMSPEQAAGRVDRLGPASDIYSLGATLYTLLTGRASVVCQDVGELLRKVQLGEIAPPRTVAEGVPLALDAVCRKAMALDPGDRYESAQELAADVNRWLADEPVLAYREPWPARVQRWLGRHRTAATSLAAITAMAFAALAIVLVLTRAGAEREKTLREEEHLAKDAAITAGRESQRYLYAAHMNLIQQARDQADLRRVRELLELYRNPAPNAADLRGWEWFYQDRQCQGDLRTLRGHTAPVTCVVFSPDGGRIASASYDNTLRLWDRATGQELRLFKPDTREEPPDPFRPDGAQIASVGFDHALKLWDTASGRVLAQFKRNRGSAASGANGKTRDSAGDDLSPKSWDAATAEELHALKGSSCVVFSPDGAKIATASDDNIVMLWDAVKGQEICAFEGHSGTANSVAFSPDGALLASASHDRTVKLWDVVTHKEVRTFRGHSSEVNWVAFSPDGSKIASAGRDQTIKLWDASSGREIRTLRGHPSAVTGVAFSPDGAQIASSSLDNTIKLWDTTTGQESTTFSGHAADVAGVAFSPDGAALASASFDNSVKLWDALSTREPRTFKGHSADVTGVAFSPDGKRIVSGSHDNTLEIWDAVSGQEVQVLKGHLSAVTCLAFSSDGAKLASASRDGALILWDARSGQESWRIKGSSEFVSSVAFSADGAKIATGSYDRTVKLWDTNTGRELHNLQGHRRRISCVAFSPNGSTLVSASYDRTLKLWDVATGQELRTFEGHSAPVISVAFSPSSTEIASGSYDGTLKLWDADNGRELRTLAGHSEPVYSVAFNPDGSRLASAGADHSVKLWDPVNGQEMLALKGHTDAVRSVTFSADGGKLASAGSDGTIRLWDATPLTPALRTEREARGFVEFHLGKVQTKVDLISGLRSSPGRTEAVRNRALELVEEYWGRKSK